MADVMKLAFETIGDNTGVPEPSALALDETPDVYLHPERPFTNVYAVRKVIRGLEGSVLWYEQHMDPKILELLSDDLDLEGVTGLRLLSGPAHITPKAKKAFERFAAELEHAGVQCDWRVLPPDVARTMHARVIFDDKQTFELPPLNSVLAGTVDSIRISQIPRDAFEEAWADHGESLLQFDPI